MLNFVVCMKQVPMVSELPWDAASGRLKRDLAEGMLNPACKVALEAALQMKSKHGGHITALSMGPPMAEEILREAVAMGADQGVLLTDSRMAGADTLITSHTLARAIRKKCRDFDLIFCGCQTSDSETAQVGPQIAEELDIPGVAYVEKLELKDQILRIQREADDFLETFEMTLPGLVTIKARHYTPRYASLIGLQDAFEHGLVEILNADDIGLDAAQIGMQASPTRILNVYSPVAEKANTVIRGSAKRVVGELLEGFGDQIGGALGKDLKADTHKETTNG